MSGRPRLLALRALGLGDLLTAVPALRALARAFPEHERVLATPPGLWPLARLIDVPRAAGEAGEGLAGGRCDAAVPVVHRLVPADGRGVERMAALAERGLLAAAGAEVAVNLHGRGPQSHRVLLACSPRSLLGFRHPAVPESAGAPVWRADEHEVARWCRMLGENGIPADPSELRLSVAPAPVGRGATMIHPGASSAARRWPVERFAAVARAERARGRDVVVSGAPSERALADSVARAAGLPQSQVVAGRTGLAGLARLVAAAGRVVCGDTGVAHLAAAVGTPSVVLFGPVPPSEWGPPAGEERHIALWAGGRGYPHAARPDAGLLEIGLAEVIDALGRLPA